MQRKSVFNLLRGFLLALTLILSTVAYPQEENEHSYSSIYFQQAASLLLNSSPHFIHNWLMAISFSRVFLSQRNATPSCIRYWHGDIPLDQALDQLPEHCRLIVPPGVTRLEVTAIFREGQSIEVEKETGSELLISAKYSYHLLDNGYVFKSANQLKTFLSHSGQGTLQVLPPFDSAAFLISGNHVSIDSHIEIIIPASSMPGDELSSGLMFTDSKALETVRGSSSLVFEETTTTDKLYDHFFFPDTSLKGAIQHHGDSAKKNGKTNNSSKENTNGTRDTHRKRTSSSPSTSERSSASGAGGDGRKPPNSWSSLLPADWAEMFTILDKIWAYLFNSLGGQNNFFVLHLLDELQHLLVNMDRSQLSDRQYTQLTRAIHDALRNHLSIKECAPCSQPTDFRTHYYKNLTGSASSAGKNIDGDFIQRLIADFATHCDLRQLRALASDRSTYFSRGTVRNSFRGTFQQTHIPDSDSKETNSEHRQHSPQLRRTYSQRPAQRPHLLQPESLQGNSNSLNLGGVLPVRQPFSRSNSFHPPTGTRGKPLQLPIESRGRPSQHLRQSMRAQRSDYSQKSVSTTASTPSGTSKLILIPKETAFPEASPQMQPDFLDTTPRSRRTRVSLPNTESGLQNSTPPSTAVEEPELLDQMPKLESVSSTNALILPIPTLSAAEEAADEAKAAEEAADEAKAKAKAAAFCTSDEVTDSSIHSLFHVLSEWFTPNSSSDPLNTMTVLASAMVDQLDWNDLMGIYYHLEQNPSTQLPQQFRDIILRGRLPLGEELGNYYRLRESDERKRRILAIEHLIHTYMNMTHGENWSSSTFSTGIKIWLARAIANVLGEKKTQSVIENIKEAIQEQG